MREPVEDVVRLEEISDGTWVPAEVFTLVSGNGVD